VPDGPAHQLGQAELPCPTDSIPGDINDSYQCPWIALLSVRLDTAAGAHSDPFAQYELGKRMHVDQLVVMREVLTK
jgi:hypothetical protein